MVTSLLGGALVATTGLVLAPEPANSTSLTLPASEGVTPVSPVEKAVFVSGRGRPCIVAALERVA